jgi:type II secretory pathway component PulK
MKKGIPFALGKGSWENVKKMIKFEEKKLDIKMRGKGGGGKFSLRNCVTQLTRPDRIRYQALWNIFVKI